MSRALRPLFCLIWILFALPLSLADEFVQFDRNEVYICAVIDLNAPPPDPVTDQCERRDEAQLNLHGETVWVIGEITLPETVRQDSEPIGFTLSAKAASRVYLNGRLLTQNGVPGFDQAEEQPGAIDFVQFVPRTTLREGPNQIAIAMSGHHSLTGATRSVLTLGFFAFERAPYHERDAAFVGMLMLGVFLLSALYAGVLAGYGTDQSLALTLAGTSLFAAGQVIAESLRAVWAYPYFVHDLRLFALIGCGLGVGLTLLAHTLRQFSSGRPRAILAGTLLGTLGAVVLVDGFDQKASVAMLLPSLVAGLVSIFPLHRLNRTRVLYAIAFASFAVVNLLDPGAFLDLTYFSMLAAMILFLSVFQARAFVEVIRTHEKGELARRQLEHVLDEQSADARPPLTVRHSGRIERIATAEILAVEAAGDYVNLKLVSGRVLMLSRSLSDLEKDLPPRFLRVHRSHIVNADQIASLKRRRGGTGELLLKPGDVVPVSRRAMPGLRESLESL
ncbi:MAG: LytTR family DNA-binding domain-containing protein [Pseudomonadota bacterium]